MGDSTQVVNQKVRPFRSEASDTCDQRRSIEEQPSLSLVALAVFRCTTQCRDAVIVVGTHQVTQ
jgi:hypothetical protein